MKRVWARVVLGWVTSWEVLVLHPLFAFRVNLGLPSLAGDRLPLSLFFFFFVTGQPLQRDPLYRTRGGRRTSSRRRNDGHGAHGAKNRGPSIENGPI